MQSKGSRIAVIAGAIAVAVVLFLMLRPTADEGETSGGAPVSGQASDDGGSGKPGGGAKPEKAGGGGAPEPRAGVTEIEVKDGSPVGGVQDVEVESGDEVSLLVDSDVDEEIHVHGYDETAEVGPGDPARLEFAADIEGVFEVELEHSHTEIGRLEVSP